MKMIVTGGAGFIGSNFILYMMKEHPEDRRRMSEKEKLQSRNYDETVYYKNFVKMLDEIIGE